MRLPVVACVAGVKRACKNVCNTGTNGSPPPCKASEPSPSLFEVDLLIQSEYRPGKKIEQVETERAAKNSQASARNSLNRMDTGKEYKGPGSHGSWLRGSN
jgi:hypothetical protein